MIQHKHLIIRAEVSNPPTDPEFIKEWIKELVQKIDMKLLDIPNNPLAGYVDKPGNKGLTAVAIIETSNIAVHVWDECSPGLLQLDVYTCGSLDPVVVFDHLEQFDVLSKSFLFIDRENQIKKIL